MCLEPVNSLKSQVNQTYLKESPEDQVAVPRTLKGIFTIVHDRNKTERKSQELSGIDSFYVERTMITKENVSLHSIITPREDRVRP